MRDELIELITAAQENGQSFKDWTYMEIAGDIIAYADLDYPQSDIAAELVSLTQTGELTFG